MWNKKNYIVELEGVTLYVKKKLVLNNVKFQLRSGAFIYLQGATASGKSSLLKLLAAELPLKEGRARVFDFELKTLDHFSRPILRRRLGVFSLEDYPLLPHLTIEENYNLVLVATDWEEAPQREARISQVLKLLHLESERFLYPKDLDRLKQRQALFGRAILNQPELLLLDEPLIGLDSESQQALMETIYTYAQAMQSTVILATHHASMVQQFPAITLRLEHGQVHSIQQLPPASSVEQKRL